MNLYEFKKFLKGNVSSILATLVDYCGLVFFVEIIGLHYFVSTVLGACAGAVTDFSLKRNWAFLSSSHHSLKSTQIYRYLMVSAGSLVLNSLGVVIFTEKLHLPYYISKILTATLVGWFFNYPLHRWFVFGMSRACLQSRP